MLPLLLDTSVSNEMVALLVGVDAFLVEERARHPESEGAFVQQRDICRASGLDLKTVYSTKDRNGQTLIGRAQADHGLLYIAGRPRKVLHKRRGQVAEAGTYSWMSGHSSHTGCEPSSSTSTPERVVESTPRSCSGDKPTTACVGTLSANLEGQQPAEGCAREDLAALVNPASVIWMDKNMGRLAWRATCMLLVTAGVAPRQVTSQYLADLVGRDLRTGRRLLGRLRGNLVRSNGNTHTFDVRPLLARRLDSMEGGRDVLLGAGERRPRRDLGDSGYNAALSRRYLESMAARPDEGSVDWFLGHRDALLDAAAEVSADQVWVARVRSLTLESTPSFLAGSTAWARTSASTAAESPVPKAEMTAQRLQAMADRVNGVVPWSPSSTPPVHLSPFEPDLEVGDVEVVSVHLEPTGRRGVRTAVGLG
ncbi:MAG: hypothetical protein Q8R60_06765 [Mycobacteriales bacterium]|nr:hypothetical protein [Mycobacteriales bacterium]